MQSSINTPASPIESDKIEDFADAHSVELSLQSTEEMDIFESVEETDIFDELGATTNSSTRVPGKEPRYLKNSNLCELLRIPLTSQQEEVSGETEQGGVNATLESTTFELLSPQRVANKQPRYLKDNNLRKQLGLSDPPQEHEASEEVPDEGSMKAQPDKAGDEIPQPHMDGPHVEDVRKEPSDGDSIDDDTKTDTDSLESDADDLAQNDSRTCRK